MPGGGAVTVRVSATSANLGPGFDCLGLALDLRDEVEVRTDGAPGVRIQVTGEGAGEVGDGDDHLVVRALRLALDAAGAEQPRALDLVCRNVVPHGRGLGSSAAAVVAGLAAGRALAPAQGGTAPDDTTLLGLATDLEGHPDNAAAALLGGLTLAWWQDGRPHAVRLAAHPDLRALLLVPTARLATHQARSVLPASVSHEDAATNSGRAALLVHALTDDLSLLLTATEDRLHQRQRASAMPPTLQLVDALRQHGLAAVVSGAGPTVLVLTTARRRDDDCSRAEAVAGPGWELLAPDVVRDGVEVDSVA